MWSEDLVSEPTEIVVDLATAKAHLRVDHSADDSYITGLILSAQSEVEQQTALALAPQQWDFWRDGWPWKEHRDILLPRSPVNTVEVFEYYDQAGDSVTVDPQIYTLVPRKTSPSRLSLNRTKSWPNAYVGAGSSVHLRYSAGFADAAQVPQKIKQAILLLVGHWYETRVAVSVGKTAAISSSAIQMGFDMMIEDYRNRMFPFGLSQE